MRHLTLLASVPSKEALRAKIPQPERFQPEPRLLGAIEIRDLPDGTGEILMVKTGKWRHVHAMHIAAARALAEGRPMADVIERAKAQCPPKHLSYSDKLTRRFVWQLHEGGVLEIPLEPPPPVFEDRYEFVKELGRGGMGVVHLCRDRERAGGLVAIKHAWGWAKPIDRAERSIWEEAVVLSKLDHPRIPPLVDAFERNGLLHMVREFVPGKPIGEITPRVSALDSATRLRLLRDCAEALLHVHDRGLLYLDVKKDNFIVDTLAGGPILLDFGVCKPAPPEGLQLRGGVGSPGYAAPEIVRRFFASRASDVFSLGRTFVNLATDKKLKYRHTQEDVAAFLTAAGVPQAERELLVRMCADDEKDRLPTMDAVLAAIP